jgi:hypothetical protein
MSLPPKASASAALVQGVGFAMTRRHASVRGAAAIFSAPALLVLAGCSGGLSVSGMTTPYDRANAMMPIGYSETPVDKTHYQVKASGTDTTPRARVEKIAMTRAAEIGVQQKLGYFRIADVTHSVECAQGVSGYKSAKTQPSYRPTIVLDVYYAKAPDARSQPSAETFTRLKGELDSETITAEAQSAAAADVRAACGAT